MAFPTRVTSSAQAFNTAATSHDVSLPTVSAGQAICVAVQAANVIPSDSAGWTTFLSGGITSRGFKLYIKVSDGTETVLPVSLASSGVISAIAIVISGWGGSLADIAGVIKSSDSPNSDHDRLTPSWGGLDTLWVAGLGAANDGAIATNQIALQDFTQVTNSLGTDQSATVALGFYEAALSNWRPISAIGLSATQSNQCFVLAFKPGTSGISLDPTATLDDSEFEPGKAITGTYANYASAPTVVTLTDSAGNTLTPAVTINDTAKTFSTAYPARITTGTGTTLLRGAVTVELT